LISKVIRKKEANLVGIDYPSFFNRLFGISKNILRGYMVHMSEVSAKTVKEALWEGRPWILPSAVARTVALVLIAILIFWFELYSGIAYETVLNVQIALWTVLVLFLVWIVSLSNLFLMRASHRYVLRNDSLEIKTGIASLRQFVIVPSGFSDLEVIQSVMERALNYGSIIVHSQSETDSDRRMVKVRNPSKVAEQIRYVMARPIVRLEKPDSPE
jgi:membrane protein YdbS with pleckstrin-like domain